MGVVGFVFPYFFRHQTQLVVFGGGVPIPSGCKTTVGLPNLLRLSPWLYHVAPINKPWPFRTFWSFRVVVSAKRDNGRFARAEIRPRVSAGFVGHADCWIQNARCQFWFIGAAMIKRKHHRSDKAFFLILSSDMLYNYHLQTHSQGVHWGSMGVPPSS